MATITPVVKDHWFTVLDMTNNPVKGLFDSHSFNRAAAKKAAIDMWWGLSTLEENKGKDIRVYELKEVEV